MPPPSGLPRGDGHVVLVLPALFSADCLTRGFRRLLGDLGYSKEGWGAGINLGPTEAAWRVPDERLVVLAERGSGRKVRTLVGHSLGGVLARALACRNPELVRWVVTICSPFRLPTASRLEPGLSRAVALAHQRRAATRLGSPSRRRCRPPRSNAPCDGVVSWDKLH